MLLGQDVTGEHVRPQHPPSLPAPPAGSGSPGSGVRLAEPSARVWSRPTGWPLTRLLTKTIAKERAARVKDEGQATRRSGPATGRRFAPSTQQYERHSRSCWTVGSSACEVASLRWAHRSNRHSTRSSLSKGSPPAALLEPSPRSRTTTRSTTWRFNLPASSCVPTNRSSARSKRPCAPPSRTRATARRPRSRRSPSSSSPTGSASRSQGASSAPTLRPRSTHWIAPPSGTTTTK